MFDYRKHYIFSIDKFKKDMMKLGKDEKDINIDCKLWANKIDKNIVRYISKSKGYCDGHLVHPDWCEEVDPYDI